MNLGTAIGRSLRFQEAADLGFTAFRPTIPSIDVLFPNPPVFASSPAYPYQVDWSMVSMSTNEFTTQKVSTSDLTFDSAIQKCLDTGTTMFMLYGFNGKANTWLTPTTQFSFTQWASAITAGGGTTTISLTVQTRVPKGADVLIIRNGSILFRTYASSAAVAGSTSLPCTGLPAPLPAGSFIVITRQGSPGGPQTFVGVTGSDVPPNYSNIASGTLAPHFNTASPSSMLGTASQGLDENYANTLAIPIPAGGLQTGVNAGDTLWIFYPTGNSQVTLNGGAYSAGSAVTVNSTATPIPVGKGTVLLLLGVLPLVVQADVPQGSTSLVIASLSAIAAAYLTANRSASTCYTPGITTTSAFANAGSTSLSLTASTQTVTTGSGTFSATLDVAIVTDCPTSQEPYGYRLPDPGDDQNNVNAVLAMVSYAINAKGLPATRIVLETWNEADSAVFGGCGKPSNSNNDYAFGSGYWSYACKRLTSKIVSAVVAAFPGVKIAAPAFSVYEGSAACAAAHIENFSTTGFTKLQTGSFAIDSWLALISHWNVHVYPYTIDGSRYSIRLRSGLCVGGLKSYINAISDLAALNKPWLASEIGYAPWIFSTGLPSYPTPNVPCPAWDQRGSMILEILDVLGNYFQLDYGLVYRYDSQGVAVYPLTINNVGGYAASLTAQTITVNQFGVTGKLNNNTYSVALPTTPIPAGTVFVFPNSVSFTLTATLTPGTGTTTATGILDGTVANSSNSWFEDMKDPQGYHMIPFTVAVNDSYIGANNGKYRGGTFWRLADRYAPDLTKIAPSSARLPFLEFSYH